jgi:hypothetical protein
VAFVAGNAQAYLVKHSLFLPATEPEVSIRKSILTNSQKAEWQARPSRELVAGHNGYFSAIGT